MGNGLIFKLFLTARVPLTGRTQIFDSFLKLKNANSPFFYDNKNNKNRWLTFIEHSFRAGVVLRALHSLLTAHNNLISQTSSLVLFAEVETDA